MLLSADKRYKIILYYFPNTLEAYDIITNKLYIFHFVDSIIADLTANEFHYPQTLEINGTLAPTSLP